MKPRFFGSVILMICFLGLESLEQKHVVQFWKNITGNAYLLQTNDLDIKKACNAPLAQCKQSCYPVRSERHSSVFQSWMIYTVFSDQKLECKSSEFGETPLL